MTLPAIEFASRHAWPALQEQELPFGVLRYAQGVSRRANSLSLYAGAIMDWSELCDKTESFFQSHGQPAIVRVLQQQAAANQHSRGLDEFLESQAYRKVAPTCVMQLRLEQATLPCGDGDTSRVLVTSLSAWMRVWQSLLMRSEHESAIYSKMLLRIAHPHRFVVLLDDSGLPVSCGFAVCVEGLLGVFGIATATAQRNRGHASRVIQHLLAWGRQCRACVAYLQVEVSNRPAIAAYSRLGFTQSYAYWYREKSVHVT